MLVTKHKSKVVDETDPTKHEWLCPGELMRVKRVINDYLRIGRGSKVPTWSSKIEHRDRQYYSLQTPSMNIWHDIVIESPWMKGNFQHRICQKNFFWVSSPIPFCISPHYRFIKSKYNKNPSNVELSSWANQGPRAKPGSSFQAPQGHSKSWMRSLDGWKRLEVLFLKIQHHLPTSCFRNSYK